MNAGYGVKKIATIICLLVVIAGGMRVFVGCAAQEPVGNGVQAHGWLSVKEGVLVDAAGVPVQLRGVSSHGIAWYPEFANAGAIATTKAQGANVFRIAMYTAGEEGYVKKPESTQKLARLLLENVLAADMYAIMDWHILEDGDPNQYIEEAMQYFGALSKLYGDEPGLLYEICNEPNGDTTWQDIKRYADKVIPVIRKNAPNALIIVGTPNYSSDIRAVVEEPLQQGNVVYAYHCYVESVDGGYKADMELLKQNGLAVFVSEWGIGRDATQGKAEATYAQIELFLDYLDAENISWVGWALANKGERHSIVREDTTALSNWAEEELTPYGQLVFKRLGMKA